MWSPTDVGLVVAVFLWNLLLDYNHYTDLFRHYLSSKESQDVQESFKHLDAWYDENVSIFLIDRAVLVIENTCIALPNQCGVWGERFAKYWRIRDV